MSGAYNPATLTRGMLQNCRDFFYPKDLFVDGVYQPQNDPEGMLYGVAMGEDILSAAPAVSLRLINERAAHIRETYTLPLYIRRFMFKSGICLPAAGKNAPGTPLSEVSPDEAYITALAARLQSHAGCRKATAEKLAAAFITPSPQDSLTREDLLRLSFALEFQPGDLIIFLADYHADARALNWREPRELACAHALHRAAMNPNAGPGDAYRHYRALKDAIAQQQKEFVPAPYTSAASVQEEISHVLAMITAETDRTFLLLHKVALQRYLALPQLEYRLYDSLIEQLNRHMHNELYLSCAYDQIIELPKDGKRIAYDSENIGLLPTVQLSSAQANALRKAGIYSKSAFTERLQHFLDTASNHGETHIPRYDSSDFEHFFYAGTPYSKSGSNYTIMSEGSQLDGELLASRLTKQKMQDMKHRKRCPRKSDLQTLAFMIISLDPAHHEQMAQSHDEFAAAPSGNFSGSASQNLEYTRMSIDLILGGLLGHIRPMTPYEYFLLLCSTSRENALETFRTVYASSFTGKA